MSELISLQNVTKSFERKKVLKDVNLSIHKGDSIALLGHNGSGKSTLLKIIAKLSNVTSGEVIYHTPIKFNYIPEHFPKMGLTAKEYIELMGGIEGLSKRKVKEISSELFEKFFIETMVDIPMKHLSKGTLQKVGVIQAIMTKPDVLLLDEPLSGQDIESQTVFINYMNDLLDQGVTIIMSCHERFLVRRISNVIYEIKNLKMVKQPLIDMETGEFDSLTFSGYAEIKSLPEDVQEWADHIQTENNQVKIMVESQYSNEIAMQMIEYGYDLRRMINE